MSILEALIVCEEGWTYSDEDALPAVVRDRGVGGGTGGSGRGCFDEVESSTEEAPEKLPFRPRESRMVSTGR